MHTYCILMEKALPCPAPWTLKISSHAQANAASLDCGFATSESDILRIAERDIVISSH